MPVEINNLGTNNIYLYFVIASHYDMTYIWLDNGPHGEVGARSWKQPSPCGHQILQCWCCSFLTPKFHLLIWKLISCLFIKFQCVFGHSNKVVSNLQLKSNEVSGLFCHDCYQQQIILVSWFFQFKKSTFFLLLVKRYSYTEPVVFFCSKIF